MDTEEEDRALLQNPETMLFFSSIKRKVDIFCDYVHVKT